MHAKRLSERGPPAAEPLAAEATEGASALRTRLAAMESGSGRIGERRRRIIREATALIAEGGLMEFSLGVVAQRAKVSLRTIYNAFENKENVLAVSMWRYFEKFEKAVSFDTSPSTLLGAIDRIITIHLRSRQVKNYSAAVALYFSPSAHPLIREVMQNMGGGLFREWLKRAADADQLAPGVDPQRLIVDLSNAQYSILHEWSIRQLSDRDVMERLLSITLILISGAVRGEARTHAEALLTDIGTRGPVVAGLIEIAGAHVADAAARVPPKSSRE